MKLPIAKEGIAYSLLLAVAVLFSIFFFPYLAFPAALALLFCLYFFRDPKKRTIPKEGEILSPAYGTVVEITEDANANYAGKGKKVGIFLSVFDVHVNYAPTAGVVTTVKHEKGRFCNALNPKAAEVNECNWVAIQAEKGKVLVKQIAGLIARRIVCPIQPGAALQAGEKIGLIQFGSRVDVWLPVDTQILIQKGERVQGGVTVIGKLK